MAAYDAAPDGEKGAVLRREGLLFQPHRLPSTVKSQISSTT